MAIKNIFHINLNCIDYDISRAFYEMLGFCVEIDIPRHTDPDTAIGLGTAPHEVRGGLLVSERGGMTARIDLLEWTGIHSKPQKRGSLDLGITRIAFDSDDLDADVARLKAAGVEFVSDIVELRPNGPNRVRFACFYDPDGNILELFTLFPDD